MKYQGRKQEGGSAKCQDSRWPHAFLVVKVERRGKSKGGRTEVRLLTCKCLWPEAYHICTAARTAKYAVLPFSVRGLMALQKHPGLCTLLPEQTLLLLHPVKILLDHAHRPEPPTWRHESRSPSNRSLPGRRTDLRPVLPTLLPCNVIQYKVECLTEAFIQNVIRNVWIACMSLTCLPRVVDSAILSGRYLPYIPIYNAVSAALC